MSWYMGAKTVKVERDMVLSGRVLCTRTDPVPPVWQAAVRTVVVAAIDPHVWPLLFVQV